MAIRKCSSNQGQSSNYSDSTSSTGAVILICTDNVKIEGGPKNVTMIAKWWLVGERVFVPVALPLLFLP